jgi:hypothetical protein
MNRLEKLKAIVTELEKELEALEKMQPKEYRQRNTEGVTRKYVRKVTPYLKDVKSLDFKLEADGKGKPPPQPRKVEPEVDDSNDVVLASNAETPKAQKKQRRTRKKKN